MLRFGLPLIAFAVLAWFFMVGLQLDPSHIPSPLIGKPVPTFALPNLEDPSATVASSDFAGQMALINVWATWCVGCRVEHEMILTIARSGQIPIYGLNWRDNRPDAQRWLEEFGDPYVATAFDADGRVGIDFGVYGAPETFLIDAQGKVLYKHLSPMTPEIWEERFVPLIKQAELASR